MDDLFILDYTLSSNRRRVISTEQIVFITVVHVMKYFVELIKKKQDVSLHDCDDELICFLILNS